MVASVAGRTVSGMESTRSTVTAGLDAILREGERLRATLQGLTPAPVEPEPRTQGEARIAGEARRWMEHEETFRLAAGLKLGLRVATRRRARNGGGCSS